MLYIYGAVFLVVAGVLYFLTPPKNSSPEAEQVSISDILKTGKTESEEVVTGEENITIKEEKINMGGKIFATMKTNYGDIKLELYPEDAPKTVENFVKLSRSDFYDGVKFHRVIKDFMLQSGDPNSKDDDWSNDGMGGPGYSFEDEINSHKLVRGVLAMANAGPNTNGSQFFIVTAEATPWLDGHHTVFGSVVEGMDVVDKIESVSTNGNDHPTTDVVVENIEIIEEEG